MHCYCGKKKLLKVLSDLVLVSVHTKYVYQYFLRLAKFFVPLLYIHTNGSSINPLGGLTNVSLGPSF